MPLQNIGSEVTTRSRQTPGYDPGKTYEGGVISLHASLHTPPTPPPSKGVNAQCRVIFGAALPLCLLGNPLEHTSLYAFSWLM